MKRFFAGMTDPGLVRSANQDAYHTDPEGRFFVVADGMGGHAGGQEASRLAIEAMYGHFQRFWDSEDSSQDLLEQAFLKANQAILYDQKLHPERSDMGTTAVALLFRQGEVWCAHVGDSRLYQMRGATLEQITRDHTWIARAVSSGTLTPDQARVHPMRHVLSQCLGREESSEIDMQQIDVKPGDRLLLCSDGLTEELSDSLIANNLKTIRACDMAASTLINAAKDHGGRDNITVVVITIDPSGNS
ncbi:Stp1/IreP family PP2C-type Ser/Thr phosphatase [Alkalinema sp. FACHB-956]|uniref:Stp1/IreP family PP2C-type Ser/Thr phosphatase n=1 Tax=Alkalinema sp. FACHB-956 TaxID=2692768 RepID=UPI001686330A|nr:Stp1/IreP family PP2C-type Ser/Thr phosphatase [Alkalinema sp. FACHB-956]MBD2325618.1 Stp1/IreP family PP2C-type Ser/Thr phosphatase [Alkalinema sp. FACHB-956]